MKKIEQEQNKKSDLFCGDSGGYCFISHKHHDWFSARSEKYGFTKDVKMEGLWTQGYALCVMKSVLF
jgi:hypothetical protein